MLHAAWPMVHCVLRVECPAAVLMTLRSIFELICPPSPDRTRVPFARCHPAAWCAHGSQPHPAP
eukprot:scaffold190_cov112-Isochrysis_galbana.AAC.1